LRREKSADLHRLLNVSSLSVAARDVRDVRLVPSVRHRVVVREIGMFEDQLQHCFDELRQGVLDVLTRTINDAFARAIASLGLPQPVALPSRAPSPTRARARRATRRPRREVARVEPQPEMTPAVESVLADPGPSKASRRAPTKGPSRNEIERLVEAGLAARLTNPELASNDATQPGSSNDA
jgi:hypothetical protein